MQWEHYSLIKDLLKAEQNKIINEALIACRHITNTINTNHCVSRAIFDTRDAALKKIVACEEELLEAVQLMIKKKYPKNKAMQSFWCISKR